MGRRFISIVAILCGVAVLSVVVDARTITVGLDGNSEYSNIQAAVDAVGTGETILLADGIYTGPGNRDVTIHKPLTIRGIGGPEHCIIDCEGETRAFTIQVNDPNGRFEIILEGLTLTRGGNVIEGGAILLDGQGTAILKNCVISENVASPDPDTWDPSGISCRGGGICSLGKWGVHLERCRIQGNQVYGDNGENDSYLPGPGGWAQGGGLYGQSGEFTLLHCIVMNNSCWGGDSGRCFDPDICGWGSKGGVARGGAITAMEANIDIRDCLVIGNYAEDGIGIYDTKGAVTILSIGKGVLSNCTFVGNRIDSYYSGGKVMSTIEAGENCSIANSILQDRDFSGNIQLSYCWIEGDPIFVDPGSWNWGFFVPGDYHLKSQAGRWDPVTMTWVKDAVTSPCIDAGDPANTGWVNELWPNGRRIDIGAYGGTAEASMSPNTIGTAADLNFDDDVDIADFAILSRAWMKNEPLLSPDLTRDNHVDLEDLALLAESWMK